MRKLVLAGLIAGAAAALPVAPAHAYCDAITSSITGGCSNPCTIAGSAYNVADRATKDRLPDDVFMCLM